MAKFEAGKLIENTLVTSFGITPYLHIIEKIACDDFIADQDFQRTFNGFFKVRQKPSGWYEAYYKLLEEQRVSPKSFEELIKAMYQVAGCIEVSFVSKLIAAVDPKMPIWDRYILCSLGLNQEWERYRNKPAEVRIEKAVKLYDEICRWYNKYLKSSNGKACIRKFDKLLPTYKDRLTNVKKMDFLLWSNRSEDSTR